MGGVAAFMGAGATVLEDLTNWKREHSLWRHAQKFFSSGPAKRSYYSLYAAMIGVRLSIQRAFPSVNHPAD